MAAALAAAAKVVIAKVMTAAIQVALGPANTPKFFSTIHTP